MLYTTQRSQSHPLRYDLYRYRLLWRLRNRDSKSPKQQNYETQPKASTIDACWSFAMEAVQSLTKWNSPRKVRSRKTARLSNHFICSYFTSVLHLIDRQICSYRFVKSWSFSACAVRRRIRECEAYLLRGLLARRERSEKQSYACAILLLCVIVHGKLSSLGPAMCSACHFVSVAHFWARSGCAYAISLLHIYFRVFFRLFSTLR